MSDLVDEIRDNACHFIRVHIRDREKSQRDEKRVQRDLMRVENARAETKNRRFMRGMGQ